MLKLDVLFGFMGILLLFILILIAQINPPTDPQITPPGNMVVSAAWPPGNIDVDLWVAHANNRPVGYAHKSGAVWSLLRDDLGAANDTTLLNYESAFTRGLPDGEYIINVKCFRCPSLPVPVFVEVRLVDGALIYSGMIEIISNKQERTVIRFRLANGVFVRGSDSRLFKAIAGGES